MTTMTKKRKKEKRKKKERKKDIHFDWSPTHAGDRQTSCL